jgi:hypothetical protein
MPALITLRPINNRTILLLLASVTDQRGQYCFVADTANMKCRRQRNRVAVQTTITYTTISAITARPREIPRT